VKKKENYLIHINEQKKMAKIPLFGWQIVGQWHASPEIGFPHHQIWEDAESTRWKQQLTQMQKMVVRVNWN
jgi:hypothetical protein